MRIVSRAISATLACTLAFPATAVAAPKAGPQPEAAGLSNPRAREHFARGQAAFEAEDYERAIPELKAAYALEPNPLLLYAWAQAERFAGRCGKAIELYRKFLESDPGPAQARLAETNILDCEAALSEERPPAPPPAPVITPTEEPPSPPPEDEPPPEITPWYRDWVGGTLVGVGAASLVAGGVVFALGRRQASNADAARTEGEYIDEVDAARVKQITGAVLLGVGGALVLGGAIRWGVWSNRNKGTSVEIGAALHPSGRGLIVQGRF